MSWYTSKNANFILNLIDVLNEKGYATENDFSELYACQYEDEFEELVGLLKQLGYDKKIVHLGKFVEECGAIYGIFDSKFDLKEQIEILKIEGKRQTDN